MLMHDKNRTSSLWTQCSVGYIGLLLLLCRAEFYQEAKNVSCLKNVNIVGLLGMCCQEEPIYAVLEYMKHGDLRQFLQARVAAESSLGRTMTTPNHRKTLRCCRR